MTVETRFVIVTTALTRLAYSYRVNKLLSYLPETENGSELLPLKAGSPNIFMDSGEAVLN